MLYAPAPLWSQHYSFPVGKIESMTFYLLDFEEFLWVNGEERLSQEIRSVFDLMPPLPEAPHQKAIEFYKYYLIVGGMPAHAKENKKFQYKVVQRCGSASLFGESIK